MKKRLYRGLRPGEALCLITQRIRPVVNPMPSSAHWMIRFVWGVSELLDIALILACLHFFSFHHLMDGLTVLHNLTADSWWWLTSTVCGVAEPSWSWYIIEAIPIIWRSALRVKIKEENLFLYYIHREQVYFHWQLTIPHKCFVLTVMTSFHICI